MAATSATLIKIASGTGCLMRWVGLLTDAGFESIDILLRDAEKVVLAEA
jgi:hypothetical protein